jgi:hypothetical protein
MKKSKQWQKPEVEVMKERKTKKYVESSRSIEVRYNLGIGPIPTPTPAAMPDIV